MPGMIIGGEEVLIPGIPEEQQLNYKDEPKLKLKMGEDMRLRKTRWVRLIVGHNTKNRSTVVVPGRGPDTKLEKRIARLWATDGRNAGAHASIDWDCTIACHCDFLLHAAYHAGVVNEVSVGFELYESSKGEVYHEQLKTAVIFTDFLTQVFQIQRQCAPSIDNRIIPRALDGGRNLVGVIGHCHVKGSKSNDPGKHYFEYLENVGYQVMNFRVDEDLHIWKNRQQKLGLAGKHMDGVPGPMTVDALQEAGYLDGLWRQPEKPNTRGGI